MSLRAEQTFGMVGGSCLPSPSNHQVGRIEEIVSSLRSAVRELRPAYLTGSEAAALVEAFAEIERLGQAGKTAAIRVVERSGEWKGGGHRTAAHWMAQATGVGVAQALGTIETARRLEKLPATEEAFRSGELSEAKVREVAAAAEVSPAQERDLLTAAQEETVASLRERCQRVRAQAAEDAEAAYLRIHRSRSLRHWRDPDGAFRLALRTTPDEGASLLAAMEPHRRAIFARARREGRREPAEAYAADALVALATGEAHPPAEVRVRVDREALLRGRTEPGERCEIDGVGPVPVSVACRLCNDALVNVLLTEGADVAAVAHVGRTIPSRLRTALEARDPTCCVPGCDVRQGLEIDHRIPFAEGGPTTLENLVRMCRWHHFQKTHRGYRLGGSPGRWTWSGPDPPGG
jgi:hypothetical protein